MFRRQLPLWVIVSAILAGGSARAQMPFPADILPKRTSLERLGLERHWFAVIPLTETERLMKITLTADVRGSNGELLSGAMLFAQTDYAMLHAFEAESGRLLWSAQLGERTGFARGVAANSFAVFVSNANQFHALDRKTGRPIWKHNLRTIPTSSPACDEEIATVGLTSGMLVTLGLKRKDAKGNESLRSVPLVAWNWHSGGAVLTRPLPAGEFMVFGSSDGKTYVVQTNDGTPLYRIPTGGPIGEGFGAFGTRTLVIPAGDNNVYAIDLLTAKVLWTFPSGAPVAQEPMVADEDVYSVNTAGNMTLLDPTTGESRWTRPTQGGRLAAISATKLYLRSYNLDLFMMDRKTGRMLVDPGETHVRAGLNLREYDLDIVNRFSDRMYFATTSGMIVCMRETGQVEPRLLKDPKAHPFGYVPLEGIKPPPLNAPAAIPDGQPKNEPAAPNVDDTTNDAEKPKDPGDAPK